MGDYVNHNTEKHSLGDNIKGTDKLPTQQLGNCQGMTPNNDGRLTRPAHCLLIWDQERPGLQLIVLKSKAMKAHDAEPTMAAQDALA